MKRLLVTMFVMSAALALVAGTAAQANPAQGRVVVEFAYDLAFQRLSQKEAMHLLGARDGESLAATITFLARHNPRKLQSLDWKALARMADEDGWETSQVLAVLRHGVRPSLRDTAVAALAHESSWLERQPDEGRREALINRFLRHHGNLFMGGSVKVLGEPGSEWLHVQLAPNLRGVRLPTRFEGLPVRVSFDADPAVNPFQS